MLVLRRRFRVEVAVNTSFDVAGPIAQTTRKAIETLWRSKGMNAVVMFAQEGAVFAAWHPDAAVRRQAETRETAATHAVMNCAAAPGLPQRRIASCKRTPTNADCL